MSSGASESRSEEFTAAKAHNSSLTIPLDSQSGQVKIDSQLGSPFNVNVTENTVQEQEAEAGHCNDHVIIFGVVIKAGL